VADMIGTYWAALTAFALGDRINVLGDAYECTDAGTTGATEPVWDQNTPVTDGTVEWTYQGTYIADLTQLQVNSDHIASIVADGGYWTDDDPPVFVPTKAYTVAEQTKDRFDLFVAGTPGTGDEAAFLVRQDEITSFVTGTDITAVTNPLDVRLDTAEGTLQTVTGTTIPGIVGSVEDVAEALALTDAELAGITDPETGALSLIETSISTINQNAAGIEIRVDTLYSPDSPPSVRDRDEYLAWLDSAYNGASSQFLVSDTEIKLEVQNRKELGTTLSAAIVVEAARITSEVSERTTAVEAANALAIAQAELARTTSSAYADGIVDAEEERAIADATAKANAAKDAANLYTDGRELVITSQIAQTANSINLSVFGTQAAPGPLPAVQSQLAITQESIAAQVAGGGAEAVLAMSVTLPAQITASTRASMVAASSEAKVAAVYSPQDDGTFVIGSSTLTVAYKALKANLRTAGLLGSQITLDADEILLGGQVKAANIDVLDLNAEGSIVVGQSQVAGLDTALSDADIAARNALAYKLGYADWSAMELDARLGQTLISGGLINTNLIKVGENTLIADGVINTNLIEAGSITADKIDVLDLNSKGTVIVGQSQVTGLVDALSGKEAAGSATAAQDELAKKIGYASWTDMVAKALLGQTVISGGYINTDLIEVDAIKALVGLFNDITVTGEFDGIVKTSDLRSDAVSAGSSNMLVWVLKYSSVKAAVNAPVIILQVDIPFSGSVRTSIDLSVAGGYGAASYYINDVSQGYVSTTSGSMTTLTKDINTNVGDILTVKISNVNGQYTYAQNFKITVNSNIGLLAYLIRVFETGLSSSGASR